jgi:hypothetical protein
MSFALGADGDDVVVVVVDEDDPHALSGTQMARTSTSFTIRCTARSYAYAES